MADILIVNGVVVTVDPARRVLEDGAVAIAGDRIVAVGPTAEVTAAHPARRVIDARGKAVMPGLIDSHAHAGHGLIKTMGGGRGGLWYQACETVYTVASTEAFWHAEAKLAALERLKFGVTTGVSGTAGIIGGSGTEMTTASGAAATTGGTTMVGASAIIGKIVASGAAATAGSTAGAAATAGSTPGAAATAPPASFGLRTSLATMTYLFPPQLIVDTIGTLFIGPWTVA